MELSPVGSLGPVAARGDGSGTGGVRYGLVLRRDVRGRGGLRLPGGSPGARWLSSPGPLLSWWGGRRSCCTRGEPGDARARRRDLVPGRRGMPGRCGVHQLATLPRRTALRPDRSGSPRPSCRRPRRGRSCDPSTTCLALFPFTTTTADGWDRSTTGWCALALAAVTHPGGGGSRRPAGGASARSTPAYIGG